MYDGAGSGDLENSPDMREYSVDGIITATATYVSSLLGGRGRWPENLPYPLSEYLLISDVENRFRLVCAATEYAYEVLAHGHSMTVIALDGYDIQPLSVDSFIVFPGEAIDFLLVPDKDTVQSGRYWLRARTLGVMHKDGEFQPWNVTHEVKAILAYDNETGIDPTSSERSCTAEKPCRIFSCPFAFYPMELNRTCVALTDARSAYTADLLDSEFGLTSVGYKEYFLNFALTFAPPSINGVQFATPRALLRPGQYDNDTHIVQCPDEAECQSNGCTCTHIKQLPYNETIQVRSSVL